jgi:hypothetical protein
MMLAATSAKIRIRTSCGAPTRSSRRGFVFLKQTAEQVARPDVQRTDGRCGLRVGSGMIRRAHVEWSVRSCSLKWRRSTRRTYSSRRRAKIRSRSRHSRRTRPTQRSRGIRVGRPDRLAAAAAPAAAESIVSRAEPLHAWSPSTPEFAPRVSLARHQQLTVDRGRRGARKLMPHLLHLRPRPDGVDSG